MYPLLKKNLLVLSSSALTGKGREFEIQFDISVTCKAQVLEVLVSCFSTNSTKSLTLLQIKGFSSSI